MEKHKAEERARNEAAVYERRRAAGEVTAVESATATLGGLLPFLPSLSSLSLGDSATGCYLCKYVYLIFCCHFCYHKKILFSESKFDFWNYSIIF